MVSNDSTEVDGNAVGHNLFCQHNTPPAQYGDAYDPGEGNGPNEVRVRRSGRVQRPDRSPPSS